MFFLGAKVLRTPQPPTNVAVTASEGSASVSFTPHKHAGRDKVIEYEAVADANGT